MTPDVAVPRRVRRFGVSVVPWAARSALAMDRGWLAALLLLFLVKQLLLVVLLGPFTGHDEVDHYWYVQHLAQGHGVGEVGVVELPPEARPYDRFVADYPLNSEVIQPPFYHAALALLTLAVPGDTQQTLYLLRLVSVLLGVVVVWLAWRFAAEVFPSEPSIRIGTVVFVALQPQLSFEAAIVNHDILVILLATLASVLCVRVASGAVTVRNGLWLGIVSAAGLLTKASYGVMLPVVALALAIGLWPTIRATLRRPRRTPELLRVAWQPAALALVLPLVAVSPWFVRNYRLYGDPTGAARLQEVSDYALSAMTWSEMLFSPSFWRGRLDDFWGNYGWREIPWDNAVALPVYAVWGVAALGLLGLAVRAVTAAARRQAGPLDRPQSVGLVIAGTTVTMMVFGMLYVGLLQFTQSRFAFPAMASIGMLTSVGFAALLPVRWRWVVGPALFAGLLVLNVVVLVRFVVPYYVGPGGGELIVPGQ